jgi:hypothetical protein
LGLLQASGPSRTPVGLGQAIGQAGMQGINAFHQTNQANQQNQMFQMKLAEVQREAEERKKKEAAMAALRADPRFKNMGPLLDAAPQAAITAALQKQQTPFSRLNPKDYTRESLTAYQKTGDVADLVPVSETPRDDDFSRSLKESGVLPGTPEWIAAHKDRATKLRTSTPLVQMGQEETAFQKEVGKSLGEQYSGLMKADMNAPASVAKYQRLGQLLSSVNTGKFKGTTTDLKAAAKSLGIDLNTLGVADDVAPAQAARALSNQLALEMRNPAGGAGMPGALSDKDREFLIQSIPGLENDPAAIGTMVDYRVRLEKRAQQVAKKAREYRRKNGGKFDERFFDDLQEWSDKNPLFPESSNFNSPKPDGLTPQEAAELEELRKRFKK